MDLRVMFARAGWAATCAAAVVVLSAPPVTAQSLGTVAKESEAKRKASKSSGKVYTNDSLKSAPAPSQPATAATPAPAAEQTPGTDEKPKSDPGRDEATWRERIKSERDALARSEAFASALQSQINGLYAEFTACQAPTQCKDVSEKRQKSLAELDRVKKEVAAHTKAITDIQEEARRAGVPAGWVR
jgi:hypothetical protein